MSDKKVKRPYTSLDAMAERVAEVVNTFAGRPIKPEDVNLRMVAEFCWALDVTPSIELEMLLDRTAKEQPE